MKATWVLGQAPNQESYVNLAWLNKNTDIVEVPSSWYLPPCASERCVNRQWEDGLDAVSCAIHSGGVGACINHCFPCPLSPPTPWVPGVSSRLLTFQWVSRTHCVRKCSGTCWPVFLCCYLHAVEHASTSLKVKYI